MFPCAAVADDDEDDGDVFVFGAPPPPPTPVAPSSTTPDSSPGAAPQARMEVLIESIRANYGYVTDSDPLVETLMHEVIAAIRWRPSPGWEVRLGGRVDGFIETGGEEEVMEFRGDLDESFIRLRADEMRLTIGTQRIGWGRVDEEPPTDRLSALDLRRFFQDELSDRRLAMPGARIELFTRNFRIDGIFMPWFRSAILPEPESVWHPVNSRDGRVLGLAPPEDFGPAMQVLLREGGFEEQDYSIGAAWGVRASRSGAGVDFALTLQRAPHAMPYFGIDPRARRAFLQTGSLEEALQSTHGEPIFVAFQPEAWIGGGDLGFVTGPLTWRAEAAWISDYPVTTEDLETISMQAAQWALGVEVFPGDGELRVTVQVGGFHLLEDTEVIDRDMSFYSIGEIAQPFDRERWTARVRWRAGLDHHDFYINPELAFTGLQPHDFYVGYYHFSGDEGTLGGYYEENGMLSIGWRGRM